MADTNGNVDPTHLGLYQGSLFSLAILPDLRAAGTDFRRRGYTFGIVRPWGAYRPFGIQGEMRSDYFAHNYAPLNLNPPPSPPPAPAGQSRHGFGRAADIFTNAPWAVVVEIMGAHHFTHWNDHDEPHWEWGNVLAAADVSSIPIDNTTQEEPLMTDATRVFQMIDANGKDIDDWSRIGPDVLPVGNFPGGYEATADHDTAVRWIAQYGQQATGPIKWPHDLVVAQQQFGAQEYAAHQAALAKVIAANSGAGSVLTPAQFAAAVDAILKDDFAALAKQEGTDQAALLAAISQVDENTLATFGLKRA